jgi:hypothetical protein
MTPSLSNPPSDAARGFCHDRSRRGQVRDTFFASILGRTAIAMPMIIRHGIQRLFTIVNTLPLQHCSRHVRFLSRDRD